MDILTVVILAVAVVGFMFGAMVGYVFGSQEGSLEKMEIRRELELLSFYVVRIGETIGVEMGGGDEK